MSLRLGDIAPNFTAKTSIGEINFYEYLSTIFEKNRMYLFAKNSLSLRLLKKK